MRWRKGRWDEERKETVRERETRAKMRQVGILDEEREREEMKWKKMRWREGKR